MHLSDEAIRQFQIAGRFSDVDGKGFPRELFQLSAPLIVRGLLNFAFLQMRSDWLFPYWVNRQLDPGTESFIPRGQNPLLINVTHRNWTTVGTLNGYHEAIVDPRGLATPLPSEWSIDTWVVVDGKPFFPSLAPSADQAIGANFPVLTTTFNVTGLRFTVEHFAATTNHGIDILFAKGVLRNMSGEKKSGAVGVAIRPFNPEGVAPVFSVEFHSPRIAYVNKSPGIAFAEPPDHVSFSSLESGDVAHLLRQRGLDTLNDSSKQSVHCRNGFAHATAFFTFDLGPSEEKRVHYSSALADRKQLEKRGTKQTWRVAYEKRKSEQEVKWEKELSQGGTFEFADEDLQRIFEASRLALLELNDASFISPGPFLYHHFWYRDATLMVRALDLLGFGRRAKEVIDAFPDGQTPDGFFRGPDGEWDSNGGVIWSVHQHFLLTRQLLWLRNWYPALRRAALWIVRKKKRSPNGLMPPSLSAEHLGTVDQYYWDSFWSLAGLRSMATIATILRVPRDAKLFGEEAARLTRDLVESFERAGARRGKGLIPATEEREFDESAIGCVASLYPLWLFESETSAPRTTLREITNRYVDDRGFFHPIVHSGYNPYLTLQIAHAHLLLGDSEEAWEVAETIFRQARSPFSFPEAVHPRTMGGAMGDGHHGWAAAEIVLFLRDCLVREFEEKILIFDGSGGRLVRKGKNVRLLNVPTKFGSISCTLTFTGESSARVEFEGAFDGESVPTEIVFRFPFRITSATSSSPTHISVIAEGESSTLLHCSPRIRTLFLRF